MILKIDRIKRLTITYIIVFFVLLLIAQVFVMSDYYIFKKTKSVFEFSFVKLIFCTILLLITLMPIIKPRINGFIFSALVIINLMFIIPRFVLYITMPNYDFRIIVSVLAFYFMVLWFNRLSFKSSTKTIDNRKALKILLVVSFMGLVPFIILFWPYIDFKNLLLKDIYETREIITLQVNNLYTNYTYSWYNKVILPAILIFGIYYRSKFSIFFAILGLIWLYLCGAHKAVFFGIIVVVLLYRYSYNYKTYLVTKWLVIMSIVAIFSSLFFQNEWLMTISLRRVFIVPAFLDSLYFNFFKNNYMYWSESFMGKLIHYPYDMVSSKVIGYNYFKDKTWNANNGILSDGYMNWGMMGVLINVFFTALLINYFDKQKISSRFFGLFVLLFLVLASSKFTTVLLTHGGLILVLLTALVLKNTGNTMKDQNMK